MISLQPRRGFSLFQLLVVLAMLAILFGLLFPAILKVRAAANRAQSMNNLRQLGLAVHNYHATHDAIPPGTDANHFSTAAYLLPFLEQDNLFQQLDFKKPITDEKNAKVAAIQIRTFLGPMEGQPAVKPNLAATNYLFNAGSKPGLGDNTGVCY